MGCGLRPIHPAAVAAKGRPMMVMDRYGGEGGEGAAVVDVSGSGHDGGAEASHERAECG